jgi:hypothetical protein
MWVDLTSAVHSKQDRPLCLKILSSAARERVAEAHRQ